MHPQMHPQMQPQLQPMQPAPSFIPQAQPQSGFQSRPMPSNGPFSGPANADDEIQRRLTEVLQQSQAPFQPPYHPQHHSGLSPVPPPHPQHYADQGQSRDTWQAPGNVMIEEGYSPFGQQARGTTTPARSGPHHASTAPSLGFEPMPPTDIRRSGRRMPDLQEFPEVAQREWQSKRAGSQPGTSKADASREEEGRRKGLFSRLTGLGRGKPEPAAARSNDMESQSPDEVPLPIFFGRERR